MKKIYSIALAALVTMSGYAQTKTVTRHNAVAKASKAELPLAQSPKGKKNLFKVSPKGVPAVNPVYDTYTWTDAGEGTYLDNLITSMYNIAGLDVAKACTVQTAEGHPGLYRLVNPWGANRPGNLIVDASNPNMVVLPYQSIPVVDQTDGQTYIASYSWIATSDDEDFGFSYSDEDFIEFFPELNITLDEENKFINIPANSFAYYWPEADPDSEYAGAFFDGSPKEGYIVLPGGTYISPWIDLGMGTFNECILSPVFKGTRTNEQVQVLQSRNNPSEFQIINPWKGLYSHLGFTGISPTITLDTSTPTNVLLPQASTNINGGATDGIYYVMSYSYYYSIAQGSASATPTAYRIKYAEKEEIAADGKKYSVKTFTFPYRSVVMLASASGDIYYTGSASDTAASTIVVKTEIIPDYTFNFNVLNAAGNPAEGATVTMTPEGGEAVTITTDADGNASAILKGYYDGTVVNYTVSNVVGMLDYSGSFTVEDLESNIEVKLTENPNKEYTFNFNVTNEDGQGVANTVIKVSPVISTPFTVTTDAQGKASYSIVGPYENSTVQYSIAETNAYEANSGQFTVTNLVTNANIILKAKHHDVAIAFTVKDNNGNPVVGANIAVSNSDDEIVGTVTTDENGYAITAAFADANGKIYSYVVTANKHEEAAGEITLLGYDTTVSPYTYQCPITITRLTDTYIIEFNVSNTDGEAVPGAAIALREGEAYYGDYTTDENGYAATAPLVKMEGKTLSYTVKADGYQDYEGTVTVADYDDNDLPYYVVSDIVLSKTVGIDVINADGNEGVRYFNLQGVEIRNPAKGQVVIRVAGGHSAKVVK